ncbi:MAG: Ldh family oxidoreductase [archaeon]|nr:Ldh family oxidoreductase [archaeon]
MLHKTENLRHSMEQVLLKLGAPEKDAKIVSDALLRAEMRGFGSHGILRFQKLISSIERGFQKTNTAIIIEKETNNSARLNGNSGLGIVIAKTAMELAIEKAKSNTIAAIGVHNTNHFGMAGYYTELAAKEDMIGIAMCNTNPAVMPFGGKSPTLGTNPISVAIPTHNKKHPVILDMATTNVAKGKVMKASKEKTTIPENWALDRDRNTTTDPNAMFSLVSLGGKDFGYKGYGLAFIIDILSGPLVNAQSGKDVTGTSTPEKCTKGDFFIAINISSFTDINTFKSNVEQLIKDVKEQGSMFPGEKEQIKEEQNKEDIEIQDHIYNEFKNVCKKYNVNTG